MPSFCSEFQKNGTCSYGARCKFLHDTQSEDDAWYEKVSKFLANVLRHRANELRITIRDDGFCRMSEILDLAYLKNLSVREEDLRKIVHDNAKKRFALTVEDNVSYIRANQGHTLTNVKDDELLEEIEDWRIIENCFHGTYKSKLHLIKQDGLRCMGRNHMHFACPDISTGVAVSGMREDCEVQLILNVQKCFRDGIKFYRSANGVVLTKGLPGRNSIPFEYFKEEKLLKRHYPNMPASTSSEVPKSLTEKRQMWNKPIPPPPSKSAPSRPAQASLHIESHQDFPPLSSAPGTAKKLRSSQPPAASSSSCLPMIDNHRACSSLTPASGTVILPSESQQAADDTADQLSRTQNQPNQHFYAGSSQNVRRQEQLVEEHRTGHHDREQQERPHSQVEQQNQNFGGPTCLDQPQKQFEQPPENARQGYGNKWGQQRQAGRGAAPQDWNRQGGTACDHNKSKEGGKGEKRWQSKTPSVGKNNRRGNGSWIGANSPNAYRK